MGAKNTISEIVPLQIASCFAIAVVLLSLWTPEHHLANMSGLFGKRLKDREEICRLTFRTDKTFNGN